MGVMAPTIDARHVAVTRRGTVVLPATSLALDAGGAAVVTGANGSGKTTLLSVLAGREAPSEGRVSVEGIAADERDARFRRRVTSLLGTPPMARELTLGENLAMVQASWGRPGPLGGGRELVERLRLGRLAGRLPHELSSGEGQTFALAMVLARPASVVLLDEPERRLDDERLGWVIEALVALPDVALVLATHHQRVMSAFGGPTVSLDSAA